MLLLFFSSSYGGSSDVPIVPTPDNLIKSAQATDELMNSVSLFESQKNGISVTQSQKNSITQSEF